MTYVDGKHYAKEREIASVTAEQGQPVTLDWALDSVDVRVFGDAAVSRGTFVMSRGAEVVRRLRFTNTYLRRANGWQVVAAHYTPVAAAR